MDNRNTISNLFNEISKLINVKISDYKSDHTFKTTIWKINSDNTYSINYKGQLYDVPNASGVSLSLGQPVFVKIPNGILRNMYIESVPNVLISSSGEGSSHEHSNKSVLDIITSALITAWNNAVTHISDTVKHITSTERTNWGSAYTHSTSTHARTDATKVEKSTTNGNIKINGTETVVYNHPSGTNPHGTTKSDVGLGNVDNTSDVNKPISDATQTALNAKAPLISPTLTGTPKAPTATAGTNTTQIATTAFVTTAVANGIAASDAMIIKGTIGTSGTVTSLPTTYKTGWTYRVVTAGTYAGQVCEIGDLIVALVDRSGSGNVDSDWCVAQTNINGAITGIKSGDAYIATSQSGSVVTITHKDVTRTNTTSTASPSHGGTFTAVKTVTSDAKGHVTGVDTETVTLPTYTALKNPNAISINGKSYDGSSAVNVGTIGAAYGGTGKTSLNDSANVLINSLSTGDATPSDADYYVAQYAGGGTTTTTYHRRPISTLWNYIKSKLATVATSGSYNDLSNKPTIGNGTVTIKQAGTSKGTFTMNQSGNTTIELTDNNTTYSNATTSSAGLMSASDKTKLDGIATGAEVNQNAFSNVVIGTTTISADSKTDSLTLTGSNVTLTPDTTNDKVTIGITKANVTSALGYTPPTTNTTYGVATSSTLGLVKSGTDITVDSSGNVSVNDDSHNHVISNVDGLQTALDGKASSSHTHSSYVNQNAFSNVTVGSTTIAADTTTDTLTLVGSNVTLTPDVTNDKITIGITKDNVTSALGYTPPTTNNDRKYCFVGSNVADTAGWYKVASQTMMSNYDSNIMFAVTFSYNKYRSGIFSLQMRADKTIVYCRTAKWLTRIGFESTDIRIVVDGMTWAMYVYMGQYQYGKIMFEVISESTRTDGISGITLHDSDTPEDAEPDSTISSSDGAEVNLANNLAAWKTINPGTTLNRWCKVASVTLNTVYEDYTAIMAISETEVCGGTAILVWNCQTLATNNTGGCTLKYMSGTGNLITNTYKGTFYAETITGDTSVTFNLWCQPLASYHTFVLSMLAEHSSEGVRGRYCTRYNEPAYTTDELTGTKVTYTTQDWMGNALTATALTTSAGSATQPIYFSNGKPVATTYTLGKTVPSDAVFTDTTYSNATTSTAGLMSASDKAKLDAITASADAVSVTQTLTSGTEVGKVTVNGTATTLYAPTNTDTKVTQTVTTTNASYPLLLAPNGQSATTTATSYFDSGVTLNPSTNTIAANISGTASTATSASASASTIDTSCIRNIQASTTDLVAGTSALTTGAIYVVFE